MNKYILIGLVLVLVTFTMVPTNTIRNVYGHDNYRPWFDPRDFYNYVDRYDCYRDECGGDRYYYKHYDDGECYPRYPGEYYDRDCREYYYDRCYDDRYDCDNNHHDDEREYKYEDNREYTYKYKYDDDDHYKDSKIKIYGDDDHHDDDHDDHD